MKKFSINYIGSLASIVALLFFIYFQFFKTHNKELSIKLYQTTQLTQKKTTLERLKAKFYFNDSLVQNLWVINFSLNNTGDKPIIGQGDRKDLIGDNIILKLTEGFRIIEIDSVNSNFPFTIETIGNKIQIRFKQLRPKEFFESKIFLINVESKDSIPKIEFDERGLIEIETQIINRDEKFLNKHVMDYFSERTQVVFKWMALVFVFLIMIYCELNILHWKQAQKNKWVSGLALFILLFMVLTILFQIRL